MADSGFFNTRARLTAKPRATPAATKPSESPDILTPTSLNRRVEALVKTQLPTGLLVRGEISNFTRNRSSGHLYFSLKDATSSVDAVMWAGRAALLRFEPENGTEVILTGSVGVYVPRGRYQLVADSIEPVGQGALELAKRQIEERLRSDGLLDPERKRPLPAFPRRVVLVSSPQAAGYADILKVFAAAPHVKLMLLPVPVQGPTAAPAILQQLTRLARDHARLGVDLMILARGGGSLEDLWAFNDESLARRLAAMPIPVVTGIGHETDVSIADLVADYHAHTPTEAARVVLASWLRVRDTLDTHALRLHRAMRLRLTSAGAALALIERHPYLRRPAALLDPQRQRLDELDRSLADRFTRRLDQARHTIASLEARLASRHPRSLVRLRALRLHAIAERLALSIERHRERSTARLDSADARLRALSPLSVLARGYSITRRKADGKVVRSPADVQAGDTLVTRLAQGEVESVAEDPRQKRLF